MGLRGFGAQRRTRLSDTEIFRVRVRVRVRVTNQTRNPWCGWFLHGPRSEGSKWIAELELFGLAGHTSRCLEDPGSIPDASTDRIVETAFPIYLGDRFLVREPNVYQTIWYTFVEEHRVNPMHQQVFTVPDWYDGPRGGIANYEGKPHLFQSLFKDIGSEYEEDVFLLWPISPEAMALAREDWEIWRRWEKAFHAKDTSKETHPALPEDRARYEQLQPLLVEHELRSATDDDGPGQPPTRTASTAIRATANFIPSGEDNGHASLLVHWRTMPSEQS